MTGCRTAGLQDVDGAPFCRACKCQGASSVPIVKKSNLPAFACSKNAEGFRRDHAANPHAMASVPSSTELHAHGATPMPICNAPSCLRPQPQHTAESAPAQQHPTQASQRAAPRSRAAPPPAASSALRSCPHTTLIRASHSPHPLPAPATRRRAARPRRLLLVIRVAGVAVGKHAAMG
jgi:hypothetical protein